MQKIRCFFVITLFAIMQGCGEQQVNKLMLTGSSTVAPVIEEIAQAFERHHDVRVEVQTGGSSRGINDALENIVDFGMVSRALTQQEQATLQAYTIALDGIAVIVHKDNPVSTLTSSQVSDIYRGKITVWSQLGGPDEKIIRIHKAEGRSTNSLFVDYFSLSNEEIEADVVIGDNQQGLRTLAINPSAIAYVSIGAAQYEIENGLPIRFVEVDEQMPSIQSVKSGTFGLSRPLNLVSKGQPQKQSAEFIAFTQSEEAQDIILSHYFVSPDARK